MGDGLKYVFEIDAKTPGLDALLSKLEGAEKSLPKVKNATMGVAEATSEADKEFNHLKKTLETLERPKKIEDMKKRIEELKHPVEESEGAFKRFVHAGLEPFLHKAKEIAEFEFIRRFADKIMEAPGELIEKLTELGEEMINVAAKTERTNTSFKLLFGAEQGSEVLEYLESIAGATEFTDNRLKGAAQSLAKVGFEGEKLNRALAASLDIAAFSPDKEGGFSEALSSLERVKRTGHVDNRVLGGLGIGEADFFKELSARTGEGIAGLKKKIEAGKLDSEDALETLYTMIAKKTGKDLGGAGVEVGKGLEARLTHLKDLPEQFFEKLASSPGVASFTEAAANALEALDPEGPRGQKIFGALEGAFDRLGAFVANVDIAGIADTAIGGFSKLAGFLADLPSELELPIKLLKEMWGAVKGIGDIIHDFTPVGFVYDQAKDAQRMTVENAKKAAALKQSLGGNFARNSEDDEPAWLRKGKATGEGMVAGMRAAEPKVDRAGEKLGETASGATSKALGIHSPSRVFAELGAQTAAGFAVGVEGASGMVDDVLAGAFAVPAPQGGRIAASGPPVVVAFGDIMVNVPGGSSSSAEDIGQAVRAAVRDEMLEAFEQFRTEAGV